MSGAAHGALSGLEASSEGSKCSESAPPTVRGGEYRGTSLIRNCFLLGPYRRPMPRALWRS